MNKECDRRDFMGGENGQGLRQQQVGKRLGGGDPEANADKHRRGQQRLAHKYEDGWTLSKTDSKWQCKGAWQRRTDVKDDKCGCVQK